MDVLNRGHGWSFRPDCLVVSWFEFWNKLRLIHSRDIGDEWISVKVCVECISLLGLLIVRVSAFRWYVLVASQIGLFRHFVC